ncbi:MAG: response regulator, partial [Bacteroidota bacterium]
MNGKNKIPVLHLEDNKADITAMKGFLTESSIRYDYTQASNLRRGIEIAHQQNIQVVLIDLNLTDSSGFKTLTTFLEKGPHVPVIVVTGTNNEIIGNQSVKAGAQDFLVKGQFDGKLLGRSIRYSLQRHSTQQKLATTARNLSVSEKRYIQAQSLAHFGNFEMDIVNNEMHWTEEIFKILGLHFNSLKPTLTDYIKFAHLEDKQKVEEFFDEIARSGQQGSMEHRVVQDDHTIKYVALSAKLFYDEIAEKVLLVGGVQDITERKISEQLILEKNINTKASKVKEEALMNMSFHIRTPLASVVNLVYLLEKSRLNNQQKEFLDGLKTSVDDLSMMVNNLLNFSMLATDQIKIEEEEFKIKEFLQGVRKVVQMKADNANLKLDFNIANGLPSTIFSDSIKMTQILYNLMDTAIRNTNDKEKLIVNAQIRQDEQVGSAFIFHVLDEATILTTDQLQQFEESERLLEVYSEKLEEENQQELLSIAMASKLSKILKGQFTLTSDADNGTSYRVEIPVKIGQTARVRHGNIPDAPIKILLVEDHFLNQIATKKVLTTWSDFVKVDIAENGLIGAQKQKEVGYDIILMDIQMPVMNGIDSAKRIRETSNVPIIALTANASKQEADRCMSVGINEYLGKPFKPTDLYAKIMSML